MAEQRKQRFYPYPVFLSNSLLMKNQFLIILFCFSLVAATAQESEVRAVGSFHGVKVSEAIDVYLKKGDKESVRVVATGTNLSNVLTEVSGSSLKVHMREGNYKNRNVKVYVTYVNLDRISSSSASNVFSEGTIKTGSMEINASSAASVEVSLDAERVSVDVSSAGDVTLEGEAKSLTVEASSAGSVDAYNLNCENVDASASSGGSAKVSVSKDLNAEASSAGSIRYRGSPARTNSSASSGGSVKKSN
ncbi:MAG: hypothetical protein DI538_25115 [Azospira oryzae]|jgi:hypothetical protein|nr:MAG: hypothetical protein DI538_25115 [Azospira oryzae]